jgi:hypothetical protein
MGPSLERPRVGIQLSSLKVSVFGLRVPGASFFCCCFRV